MLQIIAYNRDRKYYITAEQDGPSSRYAFVWIKLHKMATFQICFTMGGVNAVQCDQMDRLFVNFLAIYSIENLLNIKKEIENFIHSFAKH